MSRRTLVVVLLATLLGGFALDLSTPRGSGTWIIYFLVVVLSSRVEGKPGVLYFFAAIASGFTVVGFLFSPPGVPIWVSASSRFLGLVLIWTIVWVALRWRRANERLTRLQKAVDHSGEVVLMTDREGVITFINPEFTHLYGYTSEEVVGKTTPRILKSEQVAPDFYESFWKVLLDKRNVQGEIVNKRKDGRHLTVEFSANPVLDERGEITGFLGIQRDITERRRAEKALRESEEHFRSLFENMLNGFAYCRMIFEQDRPIDFIYIETNKAFETLTGLKNVIGKRVSEVIPGLRKSDPGLFEIYGRVARTGEPERFESYVDSLGMWFSISVYSPKKEHFVAVFDVITERKRAEAALRASVERYRLLFERNLAGVCRASLESGLLDCNDAYARILGYESRQEILAQPILTLYFDPAEREAYWAKLKERGSLSSFELRLRRKDGSPVWILTNDTIVEDNGQLVKEATVIDITERKRAEEALKKTQEQFLQAQKMEAVGRLAGGVAHDFNNLLTIINGYSDLMLESAPGGSREQSHLEEIRGAGERAAALTRQLLAFSRKQVIEPRILDLNAIVGRAQKMLRRLIGEDIEFVAGLAKQLGQVKADPGQVEQIIMNLVVNARDALPKGGKLVIETANAELGEDYVRSHPYVAPGNYVMLALSDTGCGMDAETQSHIFEPFYTTKKQGKGTGLGLSTVYGIVKQSGGHVNVYSELGQGTTFRVYFPRIDQPVESGSEKYWENASASGTETILAVEDEPGVRSLIQGALRASGYTVLAAAASEEALALATQHAGTIHLLLTDVIMPGLNGKELAARLTLSRPEIKVLFISGYTADAIGQHGILEEGVAFLPKPFAPRDLLRKVRQTLDGSKN